VSLLNKSIKPSKWNLQLLSEASWNAFSQRLWSWVSMHLITNVLEHFLDHYQWKWSLHITVSDATSQAASNYSRLQSGTGWEETEPQWETWLVWLHLVKESTTRGHAIERTLRCSKRAASWIKLVVLTCILQRNCALNWNKDGKWIIHWNILVEWVNYAGT